MKTLTYQIDRNHPVPMYYQLACRIKEYIRKGLLAKGARLPTEWALAGQAGVNRLTARQCYQTLEREGLIRRYRSKGTFVTARGRNDTLKTRPNVVFLTFVKKLDAYFERVVKGIENGLSKRGINLVVQFAPENEESKARDVLRMRPDGLIWTIWDYGQAPGLIKKIQRSNLPLVLVDSRVDRMRADYAGIDLAWGTAQLVKRLLKRGCRRIRLVCFGHRNCRMETRKNVRAFRRAVGSSGLVNSDCAVETHVLSMTAALNPAPILDAIAQNHNSYDAVILHTMFADPLDYAGYLWANHSALLKRKKIGLMLSDAHPLSGIAGLPIVPVIRRDMDMGRRAAELIADRIDRKGPRHPEMILIKE